MTPLTNQVLVGDPPSGARKPTVITLLWPYISYNWLFMWDYIFYKWGDFLVLITSNNWYFGPSVCSLHSLPYPRLTQMEV